MKLFFMGLVTLASITAFANVDQYEVVYNCAAAFMGADSEVGVQLLKGGLTGKPTLRVTHVNLRHRQVDNYFVTKQATPAGRMGAANVYVGQDIKFTINMTTAPLEDGKRAATMESAVLGKVELKCEVK